MKEKRIIIYGRHSDDWMAALAADAPVWNALLPGYHLKVEQQNGGPLRAEGSAPQDLTIIPLMEKDTLYCPRNGRSLIPNQRALEILGDKGRFAKYMAAEGLSKYCPIHYPHAGVANFPCVLKRLDLNAGQGVCLVHGQSDLKEQLDQPLFKGFPYLLQSYVSGSKEYVTHCVCKRGRILWSTTYEYDLGSGVVLRVSGSAVKRARLTEKQVGELEKFLRPLSYSGPCNIDHKISNEGRVIVFEINPRLGGSLMYKENLEHLRESLHAIILHATVPKKSFSFPGLFGRFLAGSREEYCREE